VTQVGFKVHVGEGVVSGTDDDISFAGSYVFPASGAQPARVELAVWDEVSTEFDVTLHEGETFEIAGQTWRLDKIHSEGGVGAPGRVAFSHRQAHLHRLPTGPSRSLARLSALL